MWVVGCVDVSVKTSQKSKKKKSKREREREVEGGCDGVSRKEARVIGCIYEG